MQKTLFLILRSTLLKMDAERIAMQKSILDRDRKLEAIEKEIAPLRDKISLMEQRYSEMKRNSVDLDQALSEKREECRLLQEKLSSVTGNLRNEQEVSFIRKLKQSSIIVTYNNNYAIKLNVITAITNSITKSCLQ
jgi:chromosome segregation ATPase